MSAVNSAKKQAVFVLSLILIQVVCIVFFAGDVVSDYLLIWQFGIFFDWHLAIEAVATFALALGIYFETLYLLELLRRNQQLERGLKVAAGDLHRVIEAYFEDWNLTSAEKDVALFAIKGMSIAEIAELRNSRDGTIKSHLNAIYRKANVKSRGQLTSVLVEDLMSAPLDDVASGSPA